MDRQPFPEQRLLTCVTSTSEVARTGSGCAGSARKGWWTLGIRASLLVGAGLVGGSLSGCNPQPEPITAAAVEADVDPLAGCVEEKPEDFVRAFQCERLTLVETELEAANPRDVSFAFERFASSFSGKDSKRVDSVYTAGEARHTWMRLSSVSTDGEPMEAQMVAVEQGPGVRLVTCSSRGSGPSCGDAMALLVTLAK